MAIISIKQVDDDSVRVGIECCICGGFIPCGLDFGGQPPICEECRNRIKALIYPQQEDVKE